MKLLLDSHTLIWAVDAPSKLSPVALDRTRDPANDRFVSAATIWEIAIKVELGKLPLSLPYRTWMEKAFDDAAIELLPIKLDSLDRLVRLPRHHRDPFDRLIAVTALVEDISLVSIDEVFDVYGVRRIW